MRWQDALTGEARTDFEAFLDRERMNAIERLLRAEGTGVVVEQQYIRALDRVRHALVMVEREDEQYARWRQRTGQPGH